jgi:hypothetical protein
LFRLGYEELEPRTLLSAGGGFTGGGLLGQYFNNPTLSGTPAFTRQDVRVDFDWSAAPDWGSNTVAISGSPTVHLPTSNFSVRWTGRVVPRFSETYTFTLMSAGGVRLSVNGQLAINDWGIHPVRYEGRSLALQAGQAYNIELDFVQGGPTAAVRLLWQSPQTPQEVIEPATPLGVNLTSLADWSPQMLFADAMRESRRFGSPGTPWDQSAPVDAAGWPTRDFGSVILDPAGGIPDGSYALSFTGQARKILPVACAASIQNVAYNPATNTTTATVTVSGQSQLDLAFTGTQRTAGSPLNSGLTNVRLMMPVSPGSSTSYDPSVTFNSAAESLLGQFTTIRFMDYTATNGSPQVNWSDRPLPSAAQFRAGPWEYAVQLANETGKDMWINVPEQATDAYITNLANLINYGSDGTNPYTGPQAQPAFPGLNPNLKVYVEFSNEVWNYAFPQAGQNLNAAVAEVAAGNSPLNYDGTTNQYNWAERRVANRTVAISNIFRSVFGSGQMTTRVRPVLEWQYGNANDTAGQALNFINNDYNNADGRYHVSTPHPVSYYIWGGGGGWYFGVNNASGQGDVSVADASFESPVVTGYQADPAGTPWSFGGSAGIVANGSRLNGPPAPDGTQAAYIQGSGSFSATVYFTGNQADLAFSAAEGSAGNESFDVYYDNTLVGRDWRKDWKPDHTTYDLYHTLSFATTPGAHTIRFVGTGGNGTVFLDKVQVETANAMYNSGPGDPYNTVAADAKWAHAFGLHVVNYEGGFDVGGDTPTDLQKMANLDPRARQDELHGLQRVFQAGSDLALVYDSSGYSAYGLADPNIYYRNTPKVQAISAQMQQPAPAPTAGIPLPAALGQPVALPAENSYLNPSTSVARLYLLNASSPGRYTVSLYGNQGGAAGLMHFLLDGQRVPGTLSLPYWAKAPAYSPALTFTITTPGLHTLSLVVDGPGQVHLLGGRVTRTVLVPNAGFEGPYLAGGYVSNPADASWTFAGAAGITGNRNALTSGNPNAPEGAQVAFLGPTGDVSQTVSGWAAGTYRLRFFAAQRAANSTPQSFQVLIDGNVVGTFQPGSTSYAQYTTLSFTVTGGPHLIEFKALNAGGGNGTVFLDNVEVLPVSS